MKKKYFFYIAALVLIAIIIVVKQSSSPSYDSRKDKATIIFDRNTALLSYSKHAKCRMQCRHISEDEVKQILQQGTINQQKSALDGDRGPEYALEGTTEDGQRVRIIFAPKPTKTVVVTVIDLETDWPCPSCN